MGILQKISLINLQSILSDNLLNIDRINFLFRARRFEYIESNEDVFNIALEAVLNRDIVPLRHQRAQSLYELLAQSIDSYRYAVAFRTPQPIPLGSVWEMEARGLYIDFGQELKYKWPNYKGAQKCQKVLETFEKISQHSAQEWATEVRPWDTIVEQVRLLWGDRWSLYHLANISAAIKSSIDTCKDFPELFDHNVSLCRRARYARLRAGVASWWQKQSAAIENSDDAMFYLLLISTWASPATISTMLEFIDSTIVKLSTEQWTKLYQAVQDARIVTRDQQGTRPININTVLSARSEKTISLLSLRLKEENKSDVFIKRLIDYKGDDIFTLRMCQQFAIDSLSTERIDWPSALDIISRSYRKGVISEPYAVHLLTRRRGESSLPIDIAHEILSRPDEFPGFLVVIAESRYKDIVSSEVIPVGEIAKKENWFSN